MAHPGYHAVDANRNDQTPALAGSSALPAVAGEPALALVSSWLPALLPS